MVAVFDLSMETPKTLRSMRKRCFSTDPSFYLDEGAQGQSDLSKR